MPNLDHEKQQGLTAGKIICGVDEVGRGPLAGPVLAAALILPAKLPRDIKNEIRDSKKMSAQQREDLFEPLLKICCVGVAQASVEEIDTINILWASMLAMQRAVINLGRAVDVALIDGNRCPKLDCHSVPIIGGDDKSLSIAAASIIAKVTRDRLMTQLASEHPGYGWERNFGYGTPQHLRALKAQGATTWHRTSFAPVAQLNLPID